MLLVFDVGNTNIVLGLYDGDKMIYHWRAANNEPKKAGDCHSSGDDVPAGWSHL